MSVIYLCGLAVVGFLLSSFATAGIIKWARRKEILAIPNGRSSHLMPTPVGGGIAIAGLTVGLWLTYLAFARLLDPLFLVYAGAGLLLGIVSWVDDVRSVRFNVRLRFRRFAQSWQCGPSDIIKRWPYRSLE